METILILGPLPPPFIGPAIATEIILKSKLKKRFQLVHLNTGIHKSITTLGSLRLKTILLNAWIYGCLKIKIIRHWPNLVLIPISQTTSGFIKDSFYVLICRFFRRRVLLQLRGSNFKNWLSGSGRFTRAYVRWILKKTAGIIVLGEKLRGLFVDYYQVERIFAVPNGTNFVFPPNTKSDEVINLLYLGNLLPEKGILDLLKALNELQKIEVRQAYRLDVMGSWSDTQTRNQCFKILREKSMPVFFHSPEIGEKKFWLLSNANMFIFTPYKPEGHPWVIVEALAAGLPIISTDQGAISESVIDGVNGYIVDKQNPEQIAEKIKFLIENPGIRKKMGQASRQLYEENFTEDKMVEGLATVFNHVMKS